MIVDDSAWWLVVKRKRARQAPILSQTCLSLPHSSWQVKIFLSADKKSASVCVGLNYHLGLDLEVLEPRHLHCSQILVWVLGIKTGVFTLVPSENCNRAPCSGTVASVKGTVLPYLWYLAPLHHPILHRPLRNHFLRIPFFPFPLNLKREMMNIREKSASFTRSFR